MVLCRLARDFWGLLVDRQPGRLAGASPSNKQFDTSPVLVFVLSGRHRGNDSIEPVVQRVHLHLGDFASWWHFSSPFTICRCLPQLRAQQPLARALLALGFLATCLAYFLICRRLSLVFQWVFLCGFAAALPASVAAAACFRRRRWYFLWDLLMLSLAFAAFYWSAAAVLAWKAQ